MQAQIRHRRTWRLIRVSTVCKQFNHFSLGIYKSLSRTYLKLKLNSSNIKCGRVYTVYNGLTECIVFYIWSMPRKCVFEAYGNSNDPISQRNRTTLLGPSLYNLQYQMMCKRTVKVLIRPRACAADLGLRCPYFPGDTFFAWLGPFTHTIRTYLA